MVKGLSRRVYEIFSSPSASSHVAIRHVRLPEWLSERYPEVPSCVSDVNFLSMLCALVLRETICIIKEDANQNAGDRVYN